MTHTAGKLSVAESDGCLYDERGKIVAQFWDRDGSPYMYPGYRGMETDSQCKIIAELQENTDRLALCWNSHDDLLEALEAIKELTNRKQLPLTSEINELAETAIKKARQ